MWPSIKPDEIDVAEDEGWVVRRLVDRSRDHPAGQPRSAKLILSQSITDWWFGMVWNHGIFDVSINIGNVRWTTDFHIFQDGWNHQPVTVDLVEATGKRNMGITEYAAGPVLVFFLMRSRTVKSSDLDLSKLFAGKLALVWEKWHLIKFKVQILEIVTLISGKHVKLKECDYSHLIYT